MLEPLSWGSVRVPYTTLWTEERDNRQPQLRYERWAGKRLAMLCDGINKPGAGKPVFGALHGTRTRLVVRDRLCQMCLRPIPATAVGFNQGQVLRGRPLLRDGLPMHPACAMEAVRACPGMARQEEAGTLRIWRCQRDAWDFAPVLNRFRLPAHGGNTAINALLLDSREPVYSGPDILLATWARLSLSDLEAMA